MEIEAKISGIDELNRMLNEIGSPKIEKKLVSQSLRKAAKVVLKEAKNNVPVNTGTLKKSLGIVAERQRGREKKVLKVGARADQRWRGYHGHLVEYGVPARGIPAQPFLRPAVQTKFEEFLKEYMDSLDDGITKVVRKHAR